jgi:putative ABC transport system permease protein
MRTAKSLQLAFNLLVHSKLRSWLTIIGIVIGVASIVAIVSIGQGLQKSVNSRLGGLGQDLITISSGGSRAGGGFRGEGGSGASSTNTVQLSTKDVSALKLVPNIKYIEGTISGRADVYYLAQKTSASITGDDPSVFKEFQTSGLESGRYLATGDAGVIVIGYSLAHSVFRDQLLPGNILLINNIPFRVIGVLKQSTTGFGGGGNGIYMNINDARTVLANTITLKSNEFSSISVKVSNVDLVNDTTNAITTALLNSHHVRKQNQDFSVTSALELQSTLSSVTSSITLFLAAIAGVSLIVGAVGVANTMFTSVLEKTRDIGVMKAIGASNREILLIFLLNAGMVGLVGGLIGIILGMGISLALPALGLMLGIGELQTAISFSLLAYALLLSVMIGMISGAIPAYRASKLKPVDALRYE